jgi:hypothetical protein
MLRILSIVSVTPARFPKEKIRRVLSGESKSVEKGAQIAPRPDFNPAVTLHETKMPLLAWMREGIDSAHVLSSPLQP